MKRITQKPSSFVESREESYWHGAQDMAFRAGCNIEIRDTEVFLVFDSVEERICEIGDFDRPSRNRPWFKIWTAVKARFPDLYRIH